MPRRSAGQGGGIFADLRGDCGPCASSVTERWSHALEFGEGQGGSSTGSWRTARKN